MGVRSGVNSASGQFEIFDVPTGQYELRVKRTVNGVEERGKTAIAVGTTPLAGVNLTLAGPVDIDLRVEGSDPEIGLVQPFALELINRDWANEEAVSLAMKRNGKLNLTRVWPGHYRLWVHEVTGNRYVTAVSSNGKDLLREGLAVLEAAVPSPIEIRMAPGAAQLDVSVLQGGTNFA